MASMIHKISRNSASSFRVLSTIKAPILPIPNSPVSHQTLQGTTKSDPTISPSPLWRLSGVDTLNSTRSSLVFPSFPFGYCFNPVVSAEFEKLGVADTQHIEFDDARTLWADSVKKKRKRKMNKHKYKKLRKRLRRKT